MKTINQKVLFKHAKPNDLYNLYMNAKKHAAATGAPAVISDEEGSSYKVHEGYITGKNIKLVKGKMIVQTWRASSWKKENLNSILILVFEEQQGGTVLTMTHANVPDEHAASIKKGWNEHYWRPWKKYLAAK